MNVWYADLAWIGRPARRVAIEVDGDRIHAVNTDVDMPPAATRLRGLTIPGLANAHSHAAHRALRGITHHGRGDFWTWRQQMYQIASQLDPDSYYELALATYAEMALAGITAVGEFHYIHHDPSGRRYDDPAIMSKAMIAAARAAGIRITLIDTCYLRGGMDGRPLEGAQCRFGDGTVEAWAERASLLHDSDDVRIAAAIHSVRAVDTASMTVVRDWAASRKTMLHVHLSEQPAENQVCLAATGRTPTELLSSNGVLGDRTTAVHATHLTPSDITLLGTTHTSICMCPTTERDLADGVGPAHKLQSAGCHLCVGSDSQSVIDVFEEARAIEMDERLVTGRRGIHRPADLLDAVTIHGMRSIGWEAGKLAPGYLADFTTIALESPRTAGIGDAALAGVIFAATAADVVNVVVGGRTVVRDGVHTAIDDVGAALDGAIAALREGPSSVVPGNSG